LCFLHYCSHFSSCCHWLLVFIWILLSSTIYKHVLLPNVFIISIFLILQIFDLNIIFFCCKTLTSHFFVLQIYEFHIVKDLELGFCVHIVNLLSIVHILVALVISFQMSSTFCNGCMSLCLQFVKLETCCHLYCYHHATCAWSSLFCWHISYKWYFKTYSQYIFNFTINFQL